MNNINKIGTIIMNTKFTSLAAAILSLAAFNATATTQSTISCDDYDLKVEEYGISNLNGLKLEVVDSPNAKFQHMTFSPYYNYDVVLGSVQTVRMFDSSEINNTTKFYTEEQREGLPSRNGFMFEIKKLNFTDYEVTFYTEEGTSSETGEAIIDFIRPLPLNKGSDETTLVYRATDQSIDETIDAFEKLDSQCYE